MKKTLLLAFILYASFWSYGATKQVNTSANGTIINGHYVVEDFDGSPSPTLTVNKSTYLTATVAAHPANSTQAAKAVSSGNGGDVFFKFDVKLPSGKTLSDCDSLFCDLYVSSASYKKFDIYINDTKVHSISNLIDGNNSNKGTQKIKISAFNQSGASTVVANAGNSFTLGFGNDQGSATYYVDNVCLHGDLEVTPQILYTATLMPGTGTCSVSSITETSNGSGVNLPTASPSAKCASARYTFAGWAGSSITETNSAPDMLSAGAWAIPQDTTLYAVYTDGTVYNSNPNCSNSLNGTVTEGWLMLDDFEAGNIDDTYAVYKAENSTSSTTAIVKVDPVVTSNQVVLFSNQNYGHYLQLNVTLPSGKKLSDYEKISFDVYCPTGMGTYQTLRMGINQTLADLSNNGSNSLTSWTTLERDIPTSFSTFSALSTFSMELGFRTDAKDYYIDNIKLKEVIGLPTEINETTFNQIKSPFFYSRNIITTVNENIADFDIYDIEGRLLKVAYQVSTIDISDLNVGIYLIKMNMSGKLFIEKIVKNR